jgi:hypothetical protein
VEPAKAVEILAGPESPESEPAQRETDAVPQEEQPGCESRDENPESELAQREASAAPQEPVSAEVEPARPENGPSQLESAVETRSAAAGAAPRDRAGTGTRDDAADIGEEATGRGPAAAVQSRPCVPPTQGTGRPHTRGFTKLQQEQQNQHAPATPAAAAPGRCTTPPSQ